MIMPNEAKGYPYGLDKMQAISFYIPVDGKELLLGSYDTNMRINDQI